MAKVTQTDIDRLIEETPLELAQRLWSEHRPEKQGDAQRMVYDYVPEWLQDAIPPLYAQDGERDPVVWLKFFMPEGRLTFYVTEYSPKSPDEVLDLFFGYMVSPLGSDCDEFGYITLSQIKTMRGASLRSRMEVDLWWNPKRLSEVRTEILGQYAQPDTDIVHQETADEIITREVAALDDVGAKAKKIKEHEGEPCTVIVADDEITNVITPAWLYWRYGGTIHDEENLLDHEIGPARDAAARRMFQGDGDDDAEFRRYCRCVVQGMLLGQSHPQCVEAFTSDADFSPSPAWKNWEPYIGTARPDPKFDVGDRVRFGWLSEFGDTEQHLILSREWRWYENSWHYKASGKWRGENGLIAVDDDADEESFLFRAMERVWWEALQEIHTGAVSYNTPHGTESVNVTCDELLPTSTVDMPLHRSQNVPAADLHRCEPLDGGTFHAKDRVWWKNADGVIETGTVDYSHDGDVCVRCDNIATYAGGVPIARLAHVPVDMLHKGDSPIAILAAEAQGREHTDDDDDIDPSVKVVLAVEAQGRGYAYSGEDGETLTTDEAVEILDEATRPENNSAQTLTAGMLDAAECVQKAEIVPDDGKDAPERVEKSEAKKHKLPDDIPDIIEVDRGHFKGWMTVTAERIKGRWLHYRLPDGQTDKVQVIGRGMLWRVPTAA